MSLKRTQLWNWTKSDSLLNPALVQVCTACRVGPPQKPLASNQALSRCACWSMVVAFTPDHPHSTRWWARSNQTAYNHLSRWASSTKSTSHWKTDHREMELKPEALHYTGRSDLCRTSQLKLQLKLQTKFSFHYPGTDANSLGNRWLIQLGILSPKWSVHRPITNPLVANSCAKESYNI